jgi:hypothetical protein
MALPPVLRLTEGVLTPTGHVSTSARTAFVLSALSVGHDCLPRHAARRLLSHYGCQLCHHGRRLSSWLVLSCARCRCLPATCRSPDRRADVPVPPHRQVGSDVDLPKARGRLAGPGSRPVSRAGPPARLTTGLSRHPGDRTRPGMRWNGTRRRMEVYGPDGAVPGDLAQVDDDRFDDDR